MEFKNTKTKEIIFELKKHANKKNISGMKRFGICGANMLGGPAVPELRKMARDIKKTSNNTHIISLELWESGIHEARILASMISDPEKLDEKQMEKWVKDFDSWDICDQTCLNLFYLYPTAFEKAIGWTKREEEFQKRAGFALMAVLAWKDKEADDAKFIQFLPYIKKQSIDERNYVKKAVNWALRQIGKRNNNLKNDAIRAAKDILKEYSDQSRGAKWIANDAIRELEKKKF